MPKLELLFNWKALLEDSSGLSADEITKIVGTRFIVIATTYIAQYTGFGVGDVVILQYISQYYQRDTQLLHSLADFKSTTMATHTMYLKDVVPEDLYEYIKEYND